MKNIIIWVVATITITLHSCNFLDVNDYFNETMKYDSIFASKENLERYLWRIPVSFPSECDQTAILGAFACDEAFSMTDNFPGMQYVLGNVTPTRIGSTAIWNTNYIIIRKCNTFLANMDKAADMTALDRREMLGYVYFMRAFAYYQLAMQYGPLVILGDDVLNTNEETAYYDRPRETFDNTVDYVCAELEKSAAYLPQTVPLSLFGRPTRGAALGLIARLRLVQASPQWNGGEAARRTYGSWKRSTDGVHYVTQPENADESKWATAAWACKRIIDMNVWSLHTVAKMLDTPSLPATVSDLPFPDGAGDIDPYRSYADIFNGEGVAMRNPEFLWGIMAGSMTNLGRHSFPVLNLGGSNSISIPQKMVDAYRMADGRTIEEVPGYDVGFLDGADRTFSGYRLRNSASNMYVNREMRFYANIGFCEAFWPCNSTTSTGKRNQTLTYYMDGNAGKTSTNNNPGNYCITGYTLKKYVHEDDSWGPSSEGSRVIGKSFGYIRYAEILLSYVEALNNLTTSHTVTDSEGNNYTFTRNTDEMARYYNMVRFRAGLPGLTTEELASAQTMQSLIERERMVEFLFENRRYYDVRRWGKYELTESEPMTGMDTDATYYGYYVEVPINHSRARNRVVDKKLILYPIDLNEVRKASSLDQNPGWQN